MTDNNTGLPMQARRNRTRVEWGRFLNPYEYVLLDKMLFQSYLTEANNGEGFKFHVRTLARETGISTGKVSNITRSWPFVTRRGSTKAMTIQFNYPAFESWIAHRMDNHCSSDEPRSSTQKDSTVPHGVHTLNKPTETNLLEQEYKRFLQDASAGNCPSEARVEPSEATAIPVVNGAKPLPTEGQNPTVHPMNDKKAAPYFPVQIMPLEMPKNIKRGPSAARQTEVLNRVNRLGFSFVRDTVMGSERDGFKFFAVDDDQKVILITADDTRYVNNPKIQSLCKHFAGLRYDVMLWTEQDQHIFKVVRGSKQDPAAATPISVAA
jgi:hypothetical protein